MLKDFNKKKDLKMVGFVKHKWNLYETVPRTDKKIYLVKEVRR